MQAPAIDFCPSRAPRLVSEMRRFFRGRCLQIERIREIVQQQLPSARSVLVTSSPVQGLATTTSDIDLIAVVPDDERSGGMATQIYVDGHHCEVAVIAQLDFDAACAAMHRLADAPLNELLDGIAIWDKAQPVRRKYLERMINGVTLDGTIPNAGLLRPLSRLWAGQALGNFLDAVTAMQLSWLAGERRAPEIYANAAADFAMDTSLCAAGYVYSNRKWIGSRWRLFGDAALEHARTVGRSLPDLGALKVGLRAAIGQGLPSELRQALLACVPPLAYCAAGLDQVDVALRARADLAWHQLGPGSSAAFARFGERAAILQPLAMPMNGLLKRAIGQAEARTLLAGLRAGVFVVRVPA
jgi:hypothetical protein